MLWFEGKVGRQLLGRNRRKKRENAEMAEGCLRRSWKKGGGRGVAVWGLEAGVFFAEVVC